MGNKHINNNYNKNCFEKTLSIPLILNQIFHFLDKNDIKSLNLYNKKIYKLYCDQVKELIIDKNAEMPNLKSLIDKYDNTNKLVLSECQNIKDFTPLFQLERLEILDINSTNISDISLISKIKI